MLQTLVSKTDFMKTLVSCVCVLLFTTMCTAQQAPMLKVGNSQVGLSSLDITVEIIGNKATTTFDMLYYNPKNQVLEGELSFPLGENFNVSRFALDVNGKLREAVVVDKELGRIAFEEVVRRRVDPALLEKGTGNNYKARIYPIPAKGYKRVVLAYEQELLYKESSYYYDLPLHFENQLQNFSLDITVYEQEAQPVIEKGTVSGLNFKNWQRNFRTQLEKSNYTPNKSLLINIPTKVNTKKVLVSDDYFYSHLILNPQKKLRKKASEITLFWDASFSMKDRDFAKEVKLLDQYFSYTKDVVVQLKTFSNTIRKEEKYRIRNGNWSMLKKELQNTVYDGGTRYELLNTITKDSDLVLLFSDGIQSLSAASYDTKIPLIVINSGKKSNHAALKAMAEASNGSYINLTAKSAQEAFETLKYQQYQFLGVDSSVKMMDLYPKAGINVDNTFSIAGKNIHTTKSIVLYFGYDNQVYESITLNLKDSQQGTSNIPRLWAQKRLDFLQKNAKENKKDIIQLATNYGLVTDYTSLIVLEFARDYARYKIEPPEELLKEYKEILAEMERNNGKLPVIIEVMNDEEEIEEMEITREFDDVRISGNQLSSGFVNTGAINTDQLSRRVPPNSIEIKEVVTEEDSIEEVPFVMIEKTPIFPGCEHITDPLELKKCFSNKVQQHVIANFNTAVANDLNLPQGRRSAYALFTINREGYVEDIRIRSSHEEITNELRRVLRLFPAVIPGKQRGKNVNVRYTLPFVFMVNSDGKVVQNAARRRPSSNNVTSTTPVNRYKYNGTLQVADPTLKAPYIEELRQLSTVNEAYNFYVLQRAKYEATPAYFVDVSNFFRNELNAVEISNRIVSNIAETDFDDYELLKVYGYQLQATNQHKLALFMFQRILELRTEDVQSYRDLALAYENIGDCQEAFNVLNDILSGKIYENTHRRVFKGVNAIVMNELNHLLEKYKGDIDTSQQKSLVLQPETFDVRIVVDWNHNDTDIDLHIIDPNREECSYKNTETKIGGHMSKDMTQGFGPEEFTLKKAIKGDYFIKVNYYGDRYQKIENPTFMKVTMYSHYGTLKETKEVKIIRLTKSKDKQIVAKMSF